MRWLLALLLTGSALAAESPREIDPNTKIEGGADLRQSGEKAGEKPAPVPAETDKIEGEKDKPISERKPQEREREDAAHGETTERPLQRFIRP